MNDEARERYFENLKKTHVLFAGKWELKLDGEDDQDAIARICNEELIDSLMNDEVTLYAGLFTGPITAGMINPACEADFKGYDRVKISMVSGSQTESVTFPKALSSSLKGITHIAVMTAAGVVIHAEELIAEGLSVTVEGINDGN